MKKFLLTISLSLVAAMSFAQQGKYFTTMLEHKKMFDSASTAEDFATVGAAFERVAEAEKKEWLPYYYAAVANILNGFMDQGAAKDELASKADELLNKAEAVGGKNSDIFVAKAMAATLHLIVDPMSRWQQYGAIQKEALEVAKNLDKTNPRIYYWEGQNLMGTPEQFGGGKEVAAKKFKESLELYSKQKTPNELYPTWGEAVTRKMLEKCQGK